MENTITQAQELRRQLVTASEQNHAFARSCNQQAKDAGRDEGDWTAEQSEQFDKRVKDFAELEKRIKRIEALADQEKAAEERQELVPVAAETETGETTDPETRKIDVEDATRRFLAKGGRALEKREREYLSLGADGDGTFITVPFKDLNRMLLEEKRAQGIGTPGLGQEFVPEGFWPSLTAAMLDFGGMAEAARVITTPTGNDLPFPTDDDTANTGVLLAENTQDAEQDIPTGETILNAYKYTSRITRVSKEMEQDSFFAVSPWVGSRHGTRLARIRNTHATTGTGTAQPRGAVTAAVDSTVTSSTAAALTREQILDIIASVDPAYRRGARVRHMFNDATHFEVQKMEDADGRPLYKVSANVRDPGNIEGYPAVVNQDMASRAATNRFWLFGDFNYFIIRMVLGITFVRMVERYADFHQIGYVSLMRFDSDMVDGGGGAIKYMAASA